MSGKILVLCAVVAVILQAGSVAAKPPSWDKRIDKPNRFKVLKEFDGEAVLDKETGLVWERTVRDESGGAVWAVLRSRCYNRDIGGRYGWRPPHIDELMGLIDPAIGDLPAGHPFDFQVTDPIVSATRYDADEVFALYPPPGPAAATHTDGASGSTIWCVRGPSGALSHF